MLLTARALQGIGGAMIMPNTLSTVSATFRGKYRAAAFGVWGAVMSSAAALGPLLGGVLTETLGWRWIFLVNLPLGIIILWQPFLWCQRPVAIPRTSLPQPLLLPFDSKALMWTFQAWCCPH